MEERTEIAGSLVYIRAGVGINPCLYLAVCHLLASDGLPVV